MSRLDWELVNRGLSNSRERAKEYILSGLVSVNGDVAKKPSQEVCESDIIEVTGETLKYVGRGGLKLERALSEFGISLDGLTCLDIGASTGGFTDCMLQSGAKTVYAVDVGHGQLAKSLAEDGRVICREGINVKDITREMFDLMIDFVSADLSFISSRYAADAAKKVLSEGGSAVILIKPQFEVGKNGLSKKGIVKDKKSRADVLYSLCEYFTSLNFEVRGLIPSPIKGGDGNIEYLIHLVKQSSFTPYYADFAELAGRNV